jgi:PAS domain S-box-containing protein
MTAALRILIVEESQSDALQIAKTLTEASLSFEWERVDCEAEFLVRLESQPDLVLADYSLKGFDAPSALQLLQNRKLDVPLIIVSDSVGEDLAVQAIQQGAADYLRKDRLKRLGRAVTQALELRRLRQAHRKAEQEAVDWRNRYEAAVRAAGQLLYDWDLNTNTVVYGGDTERVLGYSTAELNGGLDRWMQLVHPEDRELFQGQVQKARDGSETFNHDYRMIRKGGQAIHCESRGHFVRDASGRLIRKVGFVTDVTERKRAEEQLLDSQRMLETVLNNIPIGVFWKDRDSNYLGCNNTVCHAFGFNRPEELIGRTDYDLGGVKKEQADFFRAKDRSVMESGLGEFGIVEQATFADGSTVWLETSKTPLHDGQGRIVGVLGVWQDITERRRLEEQLRQSAKMEAVGQLAGGVAHDFNNILTIINGYSELLLSQLRNDDARRELVSKIHKAGLRANRLTRQLLAFSRKSVLAPVVLNLNDLIADLGKLLGPLLGEDVHLRVRPAPGLWKVKVDPGEMEQVIMNLAINARDAMRQGGDLTIETDNVILDRAFALSHADAKPGEYVILSVSDTGCGMDAKTRDRIFEPFFTTKGADKGTGLGLATVYGIVKQSGGHIDVDTEVGKGSTFKIYLPRDRETSALRKSSQATRIAPRGTETILLSEDEEGVRTLARQILERFGYTVLEARHGEEAIAIFNQNPQRIHLLITDVVMPNMSGPQLAERLLLTRPEMKVLYVSGYTDDAVVRHGVLKGQAPFLQKPFSAETLSQKVREVLDIRSSKSGAGAFVANTLAR